jgi:hypothetical protein
MHQKILIRLIKSTTPKIMQISQELKDSHIMRKMSHHPSYLKDRGYHENYKVLFILIINYNLICYPLCLTKQIFCHESHKHIGYLVIYISDFPPKNQAGIIFISATSNNYAWDIEE